MNPYIINKLRELKIGYTVMLNGLLVTKWEYNTFEVGTHGKQCLNINDAAMALKIWGDNQWQPTK